MSELFRSITLLLLLLNPFFVIIYLVDIVQKQTKREFSRILLSAGLVSCTIFTVFAVLGDVIFHDIVQAEFASFQIFGGIIFLVIGVQFVFKGTTTIDSLRGDSKDIAGAITMPILVGPGTISASIIVGKRLDAIHAIVAVCSATILSLFVMIILKVIHDYVKPKNERIIQKYIEVAGRILALYVGTISIEMIMQGLKIWIDKIHI